MKSLIAYFKNRPWLLIIIIGLFIRTFFLIDYSNSPDWDHLMVDSLFHHQWASEISDGNWVGQESFFRAPLYIYSLGIIYSIFGKSILAARILGALLGVLISLCLYLLGKEALNKKTGVVAGLFYSIYPLTIYFESELLVDTLFSLFLILSVYLLVLGLRREKTRYIILCGICIGLGALTRPLILALMPVYMIFLLIYLKDNWKNIAFLLLTTSIVIAPITIRNYLVADDYVLIASSGGINFYIGNNPESDGLSAVMPPPLGADWQIRDITYMAEQDIGRTLKQSEISSYWYKNGFDWILNNPLDFLKLYFKKMYHMFGNIEISNNRDLSTVLDSNRILKYIPLNFALLLSLAAAGLFILAVTRRNQNLCKIVLAFPILYILVVCIFFVNARFRVPLIPFLMIFSSWGIISIVTLLIGKNARAVVVPIIISSVVFFFSISNLYGIRGNDTNRRSFNMGNYYLSRGDLAIAENYYKSVIKTDSYYPNANMNLGILYLKQGNPDTARTYFEREIKSSPENAAAYSNLASLYLVQDSLSKALELATRAIKLKPYFEDPYLILLRTHYRSFDTLRIDETIRIAEENNADNSRLHLEAGLIYSGLQLFDPALVYLIKALETESAIETRDRSFYYSMSTPDNIIKGQAAYQAGYIYGFTGQIEQSIQYSSLAIEYDSTRAEAYVNLISALQLKGETGRAQSIILKAKQLFPNYPALNRFNLR